MPKLRRLPKNLNTKELESLNGTALFYPCSGDDWQTPIKLFTRYNIPDFWFVDLAYFRDQPASKARPVLYSLDDYELLDISISGPDIAEFEEKVDPRTGKIRERWIDPCIRTEHY